jgi:PAS domain S-box-containing protein
MQTSEATLRAFLESASQGILAADTRGHMTLVNAKLEELFGYTRDEMLGQPLGMLLPERFREQHARYMAGFFGAPRHRPMGLGLDLVGVRKDGTEFPLDISLSFVGEGDRRLALAFITDITERRRMEEHLRETAKLESLGVLAGGIAHDFNNLLVGVMGNASLALEQVPPTSPLRPMIEGIQTASERAADLVRQLLAYSGKGRFVIQPVDVSELIRETVDLTHASVEKNVALELDLSVVPPIDADPSQIQQLIMNLVINGAEAVGEHAGTVSIRTRVRDLDPEAARRDGFELEPGRYVEIVVSDTGCGMDEATRARIFDPFFTTKFTGRGLGLSAAKGIVRGHRGGLVVESEPGRGSTFTVLIPASGERSARYEPPPAGDLSANGTVLVVDDEQLVRTSARLALERYGYRVLLAENGRRALEVFEQFSGEISAVVLDLTMPVMSGEETLRRLQAIRPDVCVVLSSGYNEAEAVRRFRGYGLAGFLQKPYTAARLAEAVKTACPERKL